jgi:hypothetical protein
MNSVVRMTVQRKSLVLCFFYYLYVSQSVISDSRNRTLLWKILYTTFLSKPGHFPLVDTASRFEKLIFRSYLWIESFVGLKYGSLIL